MISDPYQFIAIGGRLIRPYLNLIRDGNPLTGPFPFRLNTPRKRLARAGSTRATACCEWARAGGRVWGERGCVGGPLRGPCLISDKVCPTWSTQYTWAIYVSPMGHIYVGGVGEGGDSVRACEGGNDALWGYTASLRRTGVRSTCGPISPYSGRDCVKSLRSSYTGLYPQMRVDAFRTAVRMNDAVD